MPYPVMNTILDAGYPDRLAELLAVELHATAFRDELIDTMVERFASVPSPMTGILLEHFHGAVTRVGVTDTAVPHRAEGWNLAHPLGLDRIPPTTDENIAWTRETHRALPPHLDEARWLNYLGDDQGADAVQAAYGPNYERLLDAQASLRPGERLPPQPQHRPELSWVCRCQPICSASPMRMPSGPRM